MPDDRQETSPYGRPPTPDPSAPPVPVGHAWPQQPAWPQQQTAFGAAWPRYQPAWGNWQAPSYWPPTWPQPSLPDPAAWPIGQVPWGYARPPAVKPILESPGNFHPSVPRRPILSFKAQASPRLYAVGMLVGLPAIVALLAYMAATTTGFKLGALGVPAWLVIEIVSIAGALGLIARAVAQGRQRRLDGWQDYAGPSPLLTMGALLATVTALQIPLEMGLKSLQVDLYSAGATLAVTLAYLAAYFGLVYFLAVRPGALSWRDLARPARIAPSSDDWSSSEPEIEGPRRIVVRARAAGARFGGTRIGNLLVPIALVIPLMIASSVLSLGMLLVLGLNKSDISPESVNPNDFLSRMVLLVAVAIVAPLGEEIFFRGFATNAWSRSMSRNSAILRASLFFAFVHVMNTPSSDIGLSWRVALFNFGARVPVAFALTWLYMRRRSIFASGTLHAGYNGLITLIGFIAVT